MQIDLDRVEIPPVVESWIRQLLDPQFLTLVGAFPTEQVDIRLSANRGRVRRKPVITFNGGPAEYQEEG